MKNRGDIIGSIFLFLLGIGAIIGAVQLKIGLPTEPQPGFFPFVGGIILLTVACFAAILLFRSRGAAAAQDAQD